MKNFNDEIYLYLNKLGIEKCPMQDASFIQDLPDFLKELLLGYRLTFLEFNFIDNTKLNLFEPRTFEFLGTDSQVFKNYISIASNQGLDVCVKPNDEYPMDPKLYLIDTEEVMSQDYCGENSYSPDSFSLSWFLKNIYIIE